MSPFTPSDLNHLVTTFGSVPACSVCGDPTIAASGTHLLCLPDSAFPRLSPYVEQPTSRPPDEADLWVSHPTEMNYYWAEHNGGLPEHDLEAVPEAKGPMPYLQSWKEAA